jgi:hypothetical protein
MFGFADGFFTSEIEEQDTRNTSKKDALKEDNFIYSDRLESKIKNSNCMSGYKSFWGKINYPIIWQSFIQ